MSTSPASSAEGSTGGGRKRIMYTPGPLEASIHRKVTEALHPTLLRISNDSSKHAHHSAMRASGGGNGETHFALHIVSPAFNSLPSIKRHRMVNTLLKEEFEEKGLHALSMTLRSEEEAEKARKELEAGGGV